MNTNDINISDIDDFITSVDNISDTINKLKNNTLTPKELVEIDNNISNSNKNNNSNNNSYSKQEKLENEANKLLEKQKLYGKEGKGLSKDYEVYCKLCKLEYIIIYKNCPKCNGELITQSQREKEVYAKVEELKKERAEKSKRKLLYSNYKARQLNLNSTDSKYRAWDYWEPSDSEDELPMADNPSLKVLEKDIEDRNKMFEEKKSKSEAEKKLGNDAFKVGKILESIKHYTNAIELKKDNKVFYANRASISNFFV